MALPVMRLPCGSAQTRSLCAQTIVATIEPSPFVPGVDLQITFQRKIAMLGTVLLVVLVLLLIGAIPRWPHSKGWGYGPSGGLGLVVVILLVLLLMGKL